MLFKPKVTILAVFTTDIRAYMQAVLYGQRMITSMVADR